MPEPIIRYLNKSDLIRLGAGHSDAFMSAVENGLMLHAQKHFNQPLKPYLRWGDANHIADRIIAMPCYLGGENPVAGVKWIGSREHNPRKHGLPRASAMIVLNDTETNYPVAVMEGSLISAMRTAAITGIATRYLAKKGFTDVSIIGCGQIAFFQAKTLLEQFSSIRSIHFFDLNESAKDKIIADLSALYPSVTYTAHSCAESAMASADVLVTCTLADKPYIESEWIKEGCFISNVSIMDIKPSVFLQADKVIVDDWEQSNREKKVINQLVEKGLFSKEDLHAELGEIISGKKPGRQCENEIILLNPMGMAIDDIVCAKWFYDAANTQNTGTILPLF